MSVCEAGEGMNEGCILGWLKIWSYLNLVSLAGEMIPFPSQMITLKSGGNQMKFTHGRNPPSFPIENVQEGFWPLQLPIFYNGNGVGLRPWVNFVWSSPDFRVTIYDGNGHISPARKTRFGFDHILSHPIIQKNFKSLRGFIFSNFIYLPFFPKPLFSR